MNATSAILWLRLHLRILTAAGLPAMAVCAALTLCSRTAVAQATPEEPPPPPLEPQAPPAGAPVRYSVPFQLRPVTAQTSFRTDTSFGAYQNTLAQSGFAV